MKIYCREEVYTINLCQIRSHKFIWHFGFESQNFVISKTKRAQNLINTSYWLRKIFLFLILENFSHLKAMDKKNVTRLCINKKVELTNLFYGFENTINTFFNKITYWDLEKNIFIHKKVFFVLNWSAKNK